MTGRFQSPRPALPHGAGFAFSFQPLGASPRLAGVKQHFQEFQAGEGKKIIIIYIEKSHGEGFEGSSGSNATGRASFN